MENKSNLTKKFRTALVAGSLSALLLGCPQDSEPKQNTIDMNVETISSTDAENPSKYSVTRVATFKDRLAYGDERGIYEIIDNSTGQKYLGISGIGITELGSHKEGKKTKEDER